MLNHVSIGVRDIGRAKQFYDAALGPLGYRCQHEDDAALGYGAESSVFFVEKAERPVQADTGSHLHFCFDAPSRDSVDAFHAAALRAGGSDNGGPGLRDNYGPNYYAAFVVDPDGYRIEAYCGKDG
ncbi:Catechol 2,3-dioxygenase [Mesorhizobium albiziae]|uniref:Catechol 2,3-dioxygenase n=1 Tax=Neomesorhizobium albiziae TaxID=335020 RepID=A0A1I3WYH1_9HYPH|nr:VOC family protein [Mesorhizobium albiziae]GLS31929.1 glyoxalase [Mesorhizobium albiziae]SFK11716.1 Catechol 2,3-dioxygenase [Mesorhizobium albiziae]